LNFLAGHIEPTFVTSERLDTFGSPAIGRVGAQVAALMKKMAVARPPRS